MSGCESHQASTPAPAPRLAGPTSWYTDPVYVPHSKPRHGDEEQSRRYAERYARKFRGRRKGGKP